VDATSNKPPGSVGFIGTGNMGQPMARHIAAAGFPLVVHDLERCASAELISQGARWAERPADVAEYCDVVCMSLSGPGEFKTVLAGERGVLSAARPRLLLIDFTTNAPQLVRDMHAALRRHGAALIDAPVSGGVEGARAGRLTALVGGDHDDVRRARSVLDAVASKVLHVGEIGAGSVAKVLHNCAVFCTNLAMVECLTAGVKAGVDADRLIEVFQQSGLGRNFDLQVALPATLFRGEFQPRFAMRMAHKDMKLATELGRACHVPMRMAEQCEKDMDEAIRRGWGPQDNAVFLTLQEERAHVEVRLQQSAAE